MNEVVVGTANDANYPTLAEQARVWTAVYNELQATWFVIAAKAWADNRGVGPIPVAPKKREYVAVRETMEINPRTLDELVSNLDPRTMLPKVATDENAVGGPVGGPIPDKPAGHFYQASTDQLYPGATWTAPDGRRFVKIAEGFAGLTRYWLQVA